MKVQPARVCIVTTVQTMNSKEKRLGGKKMRIAMTESERIERTREEEGKERVRYLTAAEMQMKLKKKQKGEARVNFLQDVVNKKNEQWFFFFFSYTEKHTHLH